TGVLEIGEPTKPTAKHVPMHDTCEAVEYIACTRTDINELVSIDDALSPDDADGEEIDKETVDTPGTFTGTPEMILAAETGSQLHAILAGMRTLDELDESIKWQLAIGVIKEENVDDYRTRLKDAIDFAGDYARDWFAPEWKVYAERAIYDPVNNESYRPDRVIVRTDGTCAVVDYKFTSEVRASHRRQVSNYVKLLEQMGRPGAEAYLWYPVMHKIIKV
ncbi:MAG: CRISPR-associated protein Cas4, partial [Muribaculaceae bacterium]|nr:CRISPR-associated protein Cas4 [Muribaculaceae bacterium]